MLHRQRMAGILAEGKAIMKTIQINGQAEDAEYEGTLETFIWEGKSAKEVMREAYPDSYVMKPHVQPKSTSTTVHRPTTYTVEDRRCTDGREDFGEQMGVLIELP